MSSLVVRGQTDNNNDFTLGWFEYVTCWPTQDSAPLKNLNVDAQFLPDDEVLAYSAEELLDLVYGDVLKRRLLFSAIRAYEKKLNQNKLEQTTSFPNHVKSSNNTKKKIRVTGGYLLFADDIRLKLRATNPQMRISDIGKEIQKGWQALSETNKAMWDEKAEIKDEKSEIKDEKAEIKDEKSEIKDEARRQLGFLDFPKSLQEFANCSFKPRDVTIHACLDWKRKVNDKSWCKLDTGASFQNPLIIDFSKKLVNDILFRFDIVSDFISALAVAVDVEVAVKCNSRSLKLWLDFSNNSSFGDIDQSVTCISIDQRLLALLALDVVEFVDIRSTMLATIRHHHFFQTIPLKLLEKLIWIPTVLVDSLEEWSDMFNVVERKQRVECSTRAHQAYAQAQAQAQVQSQAQAQVQA